jgi:hypothetical protein
MPALTFAMLRCAVLPLVLQVPSMGGAHGGGQGGMMGGGPSGVLPVDHTQVGLGFRARAGLRVLGARASC